MKGSVGFGESVLRARPGLNDTLVTLTLLEKLTPLSKELAKKTSSAVIVDPIFSRLSYHATSIIPPETAIVGKKCCPVKTSLTLEGLVQVVPPSVERVR